MNLGANLQYLRKLNGELTQEKIAEKLNVSRQTVSKWESGETYPELEKIVELCDFFHCTMDQFMREDMTQKREAYSAVRLETVEGFRMARYLIISPAPENDAIEHMEKWAKQSGLLDTPGYELKMIGWDFPFVSAEQKNVYGLRGYVSACILPDDFTPQCDGAEIAWQDANRYAVITITEPFRASFDLIPNAYREIMGYLDKNAIKGKAGDETIPCFERVYQKEGTCYMDVCIAVDSMMKT